MELRTPEVEKRGLTMGKAIVKLSMYVNSGMLTVNILKGRHLYSRYTHVTQPFVQVCLDPDMSGGTKCCTATVENTPHPVFNEKFSFEMLLPSDGKRRLHISAWNNNGPGHSAEFLGSMSFGLQHMLTKNKNHSGWFYLLKEEVGRRKHLPALLRSTVYEDVGAITENTPLMSRKDKERRSERIKSPPTPNKIIADVVVHSDFNALKRNKEADSLECLDSEEPVPLLRMESTSFSSPNTTVLHKTLGSPKQVRFDISQLSRTRNQDLSGCTTRSTLHTPVVHPASQNPFILQYRKNISAAENAGKQKSLLNSSLNENNLNDSCLNDSMFANTGSPDCRTKSNLKGSSTLKSESLHSFRSQTLDFSRSSQTDNNLTFQDRLENSTFNSTLASKPNEIWIDCQRLENEHDSGICDSLSPSPKSDTQTCCSCCKRKYSPMANISITSDEKSDGRTCETSFLTNTTDISCQKKGIMRQKCQQFPNEIFCGENGMSEFSTTNNFDDCENCISNYYGLERSLLTSSQRRSTQTVKSKNDSMHTKIYFL